MLEPAPWLYVRADRVESYPCVRTSDLRRLGVLTLHRDLDDYWARVPGGGGWTAVYSCEERRLTLVADDLGVRQNVRVAWAACRFGGARPWLMCPRCGSRRANLHLVRGGWACRSCQGLSYDSQRLSPRDRQALRAYRLRRSLGQDLCVMGSPLPRRPLYMRMDRYERLHERVAEAEQGYIAAPHRRL